jgi:hypothetical protein
MKHCIITFCCAIVLPILGFESGFSQQAASNLLPRQIPDRFVPIATPSHQAFARIDSGPSFYKRKAEWKSVIAQYWGPGEPTAQKQSIFDSYASYIRAHFPAFIYLKTNWDSVAGYWRSKITDSTSRGAFLAILSNLAYSINDWHAGAYDDVVYATPLNPGTPLVTVPWTTRDVRHFGAALTLLSDTSLLVYKVVPNHPLGLKPGDRVLGYEGVPWSHLVDELIEGGVATDVQLGACPSAKFYHRMVWAGMAWHLFDTIDVVKYGTAGVVHLPTSPLTTLNASAPLLQCDQLSVSGVSMPSEDLLAGDVTFGKVQGTNVGYIYVRHHADPKISQQFYNAVLALGNTDGLIIDLRMARGGSYGLENGIALLMKFGTHTFKAKARSSSSDLYALHTIVEDLSPIPGDAGTFYDRPIAVLVGPQSSSYGDASAREFTHVPNARFFGKSPMGAYTGEWTDVAGPTVAGYYLYCPDFLTVDYYFPDRQLWAKEFPVDEELWLTPDGVAKGEDDVVKRALEWMNTLSYAHDVQLAHPSKDTLRITARVENPLAHSLKVAGTLSNGGGVLIDSVLLKDDGLHGDSLSGDGLWGGQYVPTKDDTIQVSIRTDDQTAGTSRSLPNAATFVFTRRPIISVNLATISLGVISGSLSSRDTIFAVSNTGFARDLIHVYTDSGSVSPSTALAVHPAVFALPGQTSRVCSVSVSPGLLAQNINLSAKIIVDSDSGFGQTHYEIPLRFRVVWTSIVESRGLPTEFALEQNYPNPFNPLSVVGYQLPAASDVRLVVYDLLGREAAVLVNEKKEPGNHTVRFDAAGLASGVYIYKITAGAFMRSRKMIVLR